MKIEWNDREFLVDGVSVLTVEESDDFYRYKFDDSNSGSMRIGYYTFEEVKVKIEEQYAAYLVTKQPGYVAMTRRYKEVIDEYYDGIERCDRVWYDRKTGFEVLRYDLGDPANYSPDYGGSSDNEKFWKRGLDINERIPQSETVI